MARCLTLGNYLFFRCHNIIVVVLQKEESESVSFRVTLKYLLPVKGCILI